MSAYQRLKYWSHRSRLVADWADRFRERQRARAFSAHLQSSVGLATAWTASEQAKRCASDALRTVQSIPVPPLRKGSPVKSTIRETDLALVDTHLASDSIDGTTLAAAARIASLDPAEPAGFTLYLAVFWLCNESLLLQLRAAAGDRIVLHMSCEPRLARAELSVQSFANTSQLSATHLKLVGNGERYAFDSSMNLLAAPAKDSYECLPQKVFSGLALITLACNPGALLKLDDDHRLKSAERLADLLNFAATSREPMQLGDVNRTPLPSAHHRAWHFGKCADEAMNSRLLEMPGPSKWAAGSSGYIVNRPALWRILWASLYYRQWLDAILYEDIALAEVASKTGIRLIHAPLGEAIGAISDY